jgi:hypothetical protein
VPLLVALLTLVAIALLALWYNLKRAERPPAPPPPPPPAKPSPLQIKVSDVPGLKMSHFKGDLATFSAFADLLTATILGLHGWHQLPSRHAGNRGIGGLFVREVQGGGGFECLVTQSLPNNAHYDPAVMADANLAGEISHLLAIGALTKPQAEELKRGLQQGSPFFRKELWRHDVSSGLTTIFDVGSHGELCGSATHSNARLVIAMYQSVAAFDRNGVYLGRS